MEKKWTISRGGKVEIEAEDGKLTAPFKISTDEEYPSIRYISAEKKGNGKAVYTVKARKAGDYTIKIRVKAADRESDSVYITVNDGKRGVIDFEIKPKWTLLSKPLIRPDQEPKNRQPLILKLKKGANTIVFTFRENNSKIDYFIIKKKK